MARFYDKVGYGIPGEFVNGVWTDTVIEERDHSGFVLDALRSNETSSEKVNDDYRLQHRISIIADAFALEHQSTIKYVKLAGTLWTVNSVAFERPRLILSLGGVYHGPVPEA